MKGMFIMKQIIYRSIMATLILVLITCVAYPLAITGIAQLLFKDKANGSMIQADGLTVGSSLIGQNFTRTEYFHPRPSAAGNGYDASASSGSNLGPTNAKLVDEVKSNIQKVLSENPGIKVSQIPVDLVTSSASGLDPNISVQGAIIQIPRVANARGLSEAAVKRLVDENTQERQLGIFGESRVNVLTLNLALDKIKK